MKIEYSPRFRKLLQSAPRQVKQRFFEVADDFAEDPFADWLRNHTLEGKYSGLRSIDVTDDYRALFRFNEKTNTAQFSLFGTHEELYG